MSGQSMDVFALRDHVVGEHRSFATLFTTIHAEDIRGRSTPSMPAISTGPRR